MKVIILPGASLHNKEWALQVADYLKDDFDTKVIEWQHWQDASKASGGINVHAERIKIENEIGNDKVYVVAKSIGTYVVCAFLQEVMQKIEKLVLLGVPLNDLSETDKTAYRSLAKYRLENLLVIQNLNDPRGPAEAAQDFLTTVNPGISVVVKPAADHNYPYLSDIADFLK